MKCSRKSDQCMIKSSFLYIGRLRRIHVFTVNHKITALCMVTVRFNGASKIALNFVY